MPTFVTHSADTRRTATSFASYLCFARHMTPGPTLIMKAPGCKELIKFPTIASGNTFGATFWTDGKREAPMLPDALWLRKSPSEGVVFWSDECEEVGQIGLSADHEIKPEWRHLDFAEEPTERDYIDVISNGFADTEKKLRYVRTRLWWAGNDRIRRKEIDRLSDEHLKNLHALVVILAEDKDDQRLMKAEALRELSRFNDALRLLERNFPKNYRHAVQRIHGLAAVFDPKVATLF